MLGVGGGQGEKGTSKHQDRWPELERRWAQVLPDHTQAPAHDRSRKALEPAQAGTAKPGGRGVTKQEAHTTAHGISTVLESCSHYPWPLGESKQLYSDGINPVVFLVWATINPPNSTIKQQLGGLWSGPTPFHCPKALLWVTITLTLSSPFQPQFFLWKNVFATGNLAKPTSSEALSWRSPSSPRSGGRGGGRLCPQGCLPVLTVNTVPPSVYLRVCLGALRTDAFYSNDAFWHGVPLTNSVPGTEDTGLIKSQPCPVGLTVWQRMDNTRQKLYKYTYHNSAQDAIQGISTHHPAHFFHII